MFKKSKKLTVAPVAPADLGFVEATGLHYLQFLADLNDVMQPEWYLEIGSQKGSSLQKSTGRVIAVDPKFLISSDVMGGKKELHLYQMTSDEFFETGSLARLDVRVDFSFLDGMHLFEFLLRDFINAEKNASEGGFIAMHDCVPRTLVMTERDWDRSVTRQWTGDVWKIIPILQTLRPDLKVTVVDCAPTGLVVVSGLKPDNTILKDAYDQILAEYMDLTFDTFGVERFFSSFKMKNGSEISSTLIAEGVSALPRLL